MEKFVEVEGCRLFTRVEGETGKPWLVLSNSIGADHTMWDGEVGWLTARHRVLRYDARGHGRSSSPTGPATFDQLVADVVAIMDAHGASRVAFVGLSLGGMTGLGIALAHPERLDHLVCADARADAPDGYVEMWDARIAQIEAGGLMPIVPDTLERWLSPAVRQAEGERIAAMIQRTSATGYIACARALQGLAYRPHLGAIRIPTLYVVGSDDGAAPPALMRDMAAATPGATFVEIAGARHLANVDKPDGFRAAIEPFLSR